MDDIKRSQVAKTSILGSFRDGIVGMFPDKAMVQK
jgi:hypothetical protein